MPASRFLTKVFTTNNCGFRMLEESENILRAVRDGEVDLPVLSRVAQEIMLMANAEEVDLAKLSKIIHEDPTLAGHVLRIANSAAFAAAVKIVSLQQAVMRLGMNLLWEIAVSINVSTDSIPNKTLMNIMLEYRRQSLVAALFGKELARQKRRNVELQFLCGMLQSVGVPVILKQIAERYPGTEDELARTIVRDINRQVSTVVLESWGLPVQIVHACMYCDAPATAEESEDVAHLTHIALKLAEWIKDEELEDIVRANASFQHLSFYPDEITAVMSKKERVMTNVGAMLT